MFFLCTCLELYFDVDFFTASVRLHAKSFTRLKGLFYLRNSQNHYSNISCSCMHMLQCIALINCGNVLHRSLPKVMPPCLLAPTGFFLYQTSTGSVDALYIKQCGQTSEDRPQECENVLVLIPPVSSVQGDEIARTQSLALHQAISSTKDADLEITTLALESAITLDH